MRRCSTGATPAHRPAQWEAQPATTLQIESRAAPFAPDEFVAFDVPVPVLVFSARFGRHYYYPEAKFTDRGPNLSYGRSGRSVNQDDSFTTGNSTEHRSPHGMVA